MIQYPSINGWRRAPLNQHCVAFKKYDGSNLRWEWNPKRGWCKFGTRRQLFDQSSPLYNQAVPLFMAGMGDVIVDAVKNEYGNKVERITAFTEFFGPSSFAGSHDEAEQKELVLFDVAVYKRGFIPAKQFVRMFDDNVWCAEVVYEGPMTLEFVEDVRHGQYPVYEGVICKGESWMAKIKTFEYLNRLKTDRADVFITETDQ